MTREERRAAAIKRAQAAHPQFTMDHIASVLDASGLLDDDYEQVGEVIELRHDGVLFAVDPDARPALGDRLFIRKVSNTGETE